MNTRSKGEKMISIEKDLQRVVDMWWEIEHTNWEELDTPENHIFVNINNIRNWLEGQRRKENG